MGDDEYTGPPIPRNIAALLDIPLDDPDVMQGGECRHGCNGDCVYGGSEACNFTCHTLTSREDAIFEQLDRRAMELLGEEMVEFAERSLPLFVEAAELVGVEWVEQSRS
ncbi:hypothetical protein [Nonomuraea bangladeshensis]|uniref:hypothetical protein n=1 Tax=Nonomuraea bangladeshensis TaxID=404385 RepID=UPI003C2D5EF5